MSHIPQNRIVPIVVAGSHRAEVADNSWNLIPNIDATKRIREMVSIGRSAWSRLPNFRQMGREQVTGLRNAQIPGLCKDVALAATAYFLPENFSSLKWLAEKSAYTRITKRVCDYLDTKLDTKKNLPYGVSSSVPLAIMAVLPLALSHSNGAVKTFLKTNPRVESFLGNLRVASAGVALYSLASQACKKYEEFLHQLPNRKAVVKQTAAQRKQTGRSAFHSPNRAPAGSGRKPERFDLDDFMKAVDSLDTTRMPLEELQKLAVVAVTRSELDLPSVGSEEDNMHLLETFALEQDIELVTKIDQAQRDVTNAVGEHESELCRSALRTLETLRDSRRLAATVEKVPNSAQLCAHKVALENSVRELEMYHEILVASLGTPENFANFLTQVVDRMPKTKLPLFKGTLNKVLEPLANMNGKEAFVKAIMNPNRNRKDDQIISSFASHLTNRHIVNLFVRAKTFSEAIGDQSANILGHAQGLAGANMVLYKPLKAICLAKKDAKERELKANEAALALKTPAHMQTIIDCKKISRLPEERPLYPETYATVDPKGGEYMFVAQSRLLDANLKIPVFEGDKSKGAVFSPEEVQQNPHLFHVHKDESGIETVFFKFNIQDLIEEVLTKKFENLTFEEEFSIVRIEGESTLKLVFGTPSKDANQNLNHRLTGEIFRTIGLHLMRSFQKECLDGTIAEADPVVLKRNIEFLDLINNNYYVNRLNNTKNFNKNDIDYKNNAEIYPVLRGQLIDQLAQRGARSVVSAAIPRKTSNPVNATSFDSEVKAEEKLKLNDVLQGLLLELGKLVVSTDAGGRTDLRRKSFIEAYAILVGDGVGNGDRQGILRKMLAASSLEECTKVDPVLKMSLLQKFYEQVYFLQDALNNHAVCKSVQCVLSNKKTGPNRETSVQALQRLLGETLTMIDAGYTKSFMKTVFGSDIEVAEVWEKQLVAKETAQMKARAHFRQNAFEKKEPTAVEHGLMWALSGKK